MTSIKKRFLTVALLTVFCFIKLYAERIGFDNFGYLSIDFPEGFILADSDNEGTSFLLQNTEVPVDTIIRIYTDGRYKDSETALTDTLKKLGASSVDLDSVIWRSQKCGIATFNATISNAKSTGYGVSAPLPENKGILVFLVYSPEKQAGVCNSFMISMLDSLCIDKGSYLEQGIMTKYLYPSSNKNVKVNLLIDGETIVTSLKDNDIEANEYVIDREYEVLTMYSKSDRWKEAWQRYYRMIYRDSYGRLMKASFDIYNALASKSKDETDLAQKLLTWTQGMSYERNKNRSDFASLPSILQGGGSDCDSRSLLIAVLLTSWNQDAILMVSSEYAHAMVAITSPHKGHSFRFNNKDYLMGETTAQGLTWGKIASNQDKIENWIFIDF